MSKDDGVPKNEGKALMIDDDDLPADVYGSDDTVKVNDDERVAAPTHWNVNPRSDCSLHLGEK